MSINNNGLYSKLKMFLTFLLSVWWLLVHYCRIKRKYCWWLKAYKPRNTKTHYLVRVINDIKSMSKLQRLITIVIFYETPTHQIVSVSCQVSTHLIVFNDFYFLQLLPVFVSRLCMWFIGYRLYMSKLLNIFMSFMCHAKYTTLASLLCRWNKTRRCWLGS